MEQGQYQDLEDICFSDVGPLSIGTWENYTPVHLGRLAGSCVWTVEPPDGIVPGNPHCLSFSPVSGLPENDPHSSVSLPWVAVGAMHHGMIPGILYNAGTSIGPSESQGVQQGQEEPANSHNNMTKVHMVTGGQMMFGNDCPSEPNLHTMDPPFSGMPAHNLAPVTTLHDQGHVKGAKQQATCPVYSETRVNPGDCNSEASGARMNWTMPDSKSKKPCNCTKSQCLKRYCDCFAKGELCSNCNCLNCCNNAEHYIERQNAILNCLDRNPEAFKFNIVSRQEVEGHHEKGCNCKQSSCLKNYCECYKAKMVCSSTCKCVGCLNFEDNSEMKTRVRDHTEVSSDKKMHKEMRYPSLITLAVVEDTCDSLLAQAVQAERKGYCHALAQRMILQEFGHHLTQIAECI